MHIETYKGVQIHHNASKDIFYTSLVILPARNGKRDEVIENPRLQATKDAIDKFLNTAAKKPAIQKAWYRQYEDSGPYEKVEVILFNSINDTYIIRKADGKTVTMKKEYNSGYDRGSLYLACKENDAIIATLNKKEIEKQKIKKEVSCMAGKLIPVTKEHFS